MYAHCLSAGSVRVRTLVCVNLDVVQAKEKLSEVKQSRVDVPAIVEKNPVNKPAGSQINPRKGDEPLDQFLDEVVR